MELLLRHGADPNARAPDSEDLGSDEEMRFPLQLACEEKLPQSVQALIEHGANVNNPGRGYPSPLQTACERGSTKIVRLLLDQGTDLCVGDKRLDALRTAVTFGLRKVAELLLKAGAKAECDKCLRECERFRALWRGGRGAVERFLKGDLDNDSDRIYWNLDSVKDLNPYQMQRAIRESRRRRSSSLKQIEVPSYDASRSVNEKHTCGQSPAASRASDAV